MVFVSINPVTGEVDTYGSDAQSLLSRLVPGAAVFLGERCFNATVKMNPDGSYHQTTPAIFGERGKPAGARDVVNVHDGLTTITVYKSGRRWGARAIHPSESKVKNVMPVERHVVTWQWCTELSLGRAQERHWIPYTDETVSRLEEQWTSGADTFDVSINVGIRGYVIHVDRANAFWVQNDASHQKSRWVRRIHERESSAQRRRELMLQDVPQDVCCLCFDEFSESVHMPRHKTSCGHVFHAACLQPVLDRADARCPLCRCSITG